MENSYPWTDDQTFSLIKARVGIKNYSSESSDNLFRSVIEELGLTNVVTPTQARAHWESLIRKYKELSRPTLDFENEDISPSWPFLTAMQEALLILPADVGSSDNEEEEEDADTDDDECDLEGFDSIKKKISGNESKSEEDMIEALSKDYRKDAREDSDGKEEKESTLKEEQRLRVSSEEDGDFEDNDEEEEGIEDHIKDDDSDCDSKYGDDDDEEEDDDDEREEEEEEEEEDVNEDDEDEESLEEMDQSDSQSKHIRNDYVDEIWTDARVHRFLEVRAAKEPYIQKLGHVAVFREIVEELGMSEEITAVQAIKKWSQLVKQYFLYQESEEKESNADSQNTSQEMINRKLRFYSAMGKVMESVDASSPRIRRIKSPYPKRKFWTLDRTLKFIRLRSAKHCEIPRKGQAAVYQDILDNLGTKVIGFNGARRKWNSLVKLYENQPIMSGERTSTIIAAMDEAVQRCGLSILKHCKGTNVVKYSHRKTSWPVEVTKKFIKLRAERYKDFLGTRVDKHYRKILEELGLAHVWSAKAVGFKWNYLVAKYKKLTSSAQTKGSSSLYSWPFYEDMHEALQNIPEEDLRGVRKYRNYEDIWTKEVTMKFIELYATKPSHSRGRPLYPEIVKELGLTGVITPYQACVKWKNLRNRYIELSRPEISDIKRQSWPYYTAMQSIVGSPSFYLQFPDADRNSAIGPAETSHDYDDDSWDETVDERKYTCFICGKTRATLADFFFFEHNQRLLGTHQTVMELISQLMKRDVVSTKLNTCLCVECTNLVNEADSAVAMQRKVESKVQELFSERAVRDKRKAVVLDCSDEEKQKSLDNVKNLKIDLDKESKTNKNIVYPCPMCSTNFTLYSDYVEHKKEVHSSVDGVPKGVEETILENGVITYFKKDKVEDSEGTHMCGRCDLKFLSKDDLWYHQQLKHTEGDWQLKAAFKKKARKEISCHICGMKFRSHLHLKRHKNKKHGQKSKHVTCEECGYMVGNLPRLSYHMRKFHNKNITPQTTDFLCSFCGFMAPSNAKLKQHHKNNCDTHAPSSDNPKSELQQQDATHYLQNFPMKVQCDECGITLFQKNLKGHKTQMHSQYKEQCDKCGLYFATKSKMIQHINVEHLRIFLFNCEECGERFPTSEALRCHKVKKHEEPTYQCGICGKCYKRVGDLNIHIKRTHSEDSGISGSETHQTSLSSLSVPQNIKILFIKSEGMEPVVDEHVEDVEVSTNLGGYEDIVKFENEETILVTEIMEESP